MKRAGECAGAHQSLPLYGTAWQKPPVPAERIPRTEKILSKRSGANAGAEAPHYSAFFIIPAIGCGISVSLITRSISEM